ITCTTYPPSLHDALPISDDIQKEHLQTAEQEKKDQKDANSRKICQRQPEDPRRQFQEKKNQRRSQQQTSHDPRRLQRHGRKSKRSEEHTSELQSRFDLVC